MYLNENDVPFEVEHHPLVYTAHAVAASEHIAATRMARVVMAVADRALAMFVVPAASRVDEAAVATTLGVQDVQLAAEHELRHAFRDCDLGAMPPFGNLYGIPVSVDPARAEEERIFFQAGAHAETISVRYADFGPDGRREEHLSRPTHVKLLCPPTCHGGMLEVGQAVGPSPERLPTVIFSTAARRARPHDRRHDRSGRGYIVR